MSRLIDLTGQRFGMLTVLRRAESRNGKVCWTCRCDCGSTIEVSGNNLKRGHTVSCGCKRVFPYIGKRFGMLTVLEKTAETVRHGSTWSPLWKCRCDCGNIVLVRLDSITSGNIKSCGCQENKGKTEKMREAAGFIDGTQVSKIRRILEHNAVAADEEMIGVTYDPKTQKWRAHLTFQGVKHQLGYYDTLRKAADVRREAERKWFEPILKDLLPADKQEGDYEDHT